MQPVYPRRAQERGTQGWALVKFTITESGSVEDAVPVEGYCGDPEGPQEEMRPCSIFNSASARAALNQSVTLVNEEETMKEFVDKVVEANESNIAQDDEKESDETEETTANVFIQNITIQDSVVVDSVFTNSEEE